MGGWTVDEEGCVHEQNVRLESAQGRVNARVYSYGGESLPWVVVHSPPDRRGLADLERVLSLLAVALDHDELAVRPGRLRNRSKHRKKKAALSNDF